MFRSALNTLMAKSKYAHATNSFSLRQFTVKKGGAADSVWNSTERGVQYVFNDTGFEVPEVQKNYAHLFQKPADLNGLRRKIAYRCSQIGTKEIEIVLRDYMSQHAQQMTFDDLEQFDEQVLSIENP